MRLRSFSVLFLAAPALAGEAPPLAFRDVIAAALARNPLIEAARERVRAAEASRMTAGVIPNPILTYQVENVGFPGRDAPGGLEAERSTYATVPLEFLYQRAPRVRRAEEEIRVAEADLAAARWRVSLDAARAFGRVALAQAALEAADDLRRGLEELTDYNARRVAEGAAPEGELIRVRVERDRAAIEATLARADLDAAWAELRPFLPEPTVRLRVSLESAPFGPPPPSLRERIAAVPVRQPEVVAARSRVEALRAEESYQRRLPVRQLGLTFGAKDISGRYSMIAGLSVPLPFFDRNQGEKKRAEAERVAAEKELQWVERSVRARLEAAHARAAVLHEQQEKMPPDLLARAEEARQIALAAYRDGAGSLLQVLDATRGIAETRETFTRAMIAQRESMIDFFAAAGLDPAELVSDGGVR
jgi:cobalt-zinc-cadmium efflux system outer membrane protein